MAEEILQIIDVSIIIVNFNNYDLTKKFLYSLDKHSSGFIYEIIIIDNCSQDNSGIELKKEFPNYKFILNNENLGFAKANNQGLKIAKGEYILFINNDIIFLENTIDVLLNYLKNHEGKFLIAPRLLNKDKSLQHSVYSHQGIWLSFTTNFFLYKLFPNSKYFNKYYLMNSGINNKIEVENVTGAFMLSQRNHILNLKGFDDKFFFYGEDNDLCKRFRDSGGKIIYFPKTKIVHLKGGTSKTDWFHEKNRTLAELRLIKKHYSTIFQPIGYILLFAGNFIRAVIFYTIYLFTRKNYYLTAARCKFKTLTLFSN